MSLISEDENSVLLKGDGTAKDAPSDGTAASLATENSYKNEKSLRPVYQRNSRVSTQVLLSRIGSFLFASALALFVLATKRDDLDELLSLLPFNLDIHQTPSQQQVWESTAVPGTPEKDYIVCTRQKGGIYTVDESMPNIQCLVVNTEGYIVNTGSIGMCLFMACMIRSDFWIRLCQRGVSPNKATLFTKRLDCCSRNGG